MRDSDRDVWNVYWKGKADIGTVYPSSPSILRAILESVDVKGIRVLEAGAGSGRDSLELARRGAHVTVLDFSPESLRIVERLSQDLKVPNVDCVLGDAVCTPFGDNTFDLVFHQGLLEHFRDPMPLLRENHRVLTPGGLCLCDVPQTFHPLTIVKKVLIGLDKWFAGWETQYTPLSLRRRMRSAGFVIERTYGDWMRPCLAYRVIREVFKKSGVHLPLFPFHDTLYVRWKDTALDWLDRFPPAHYCQATIGVVGRKVSDL